MRGTVIYTHRGGRIYDSGGKIMKASHIEGAFYLGKSVALRRTVFWDLPHRRSSSIWWQAIIGVKQGGDALEGKANDGGIEFLLPGGNGQPLIGRQAPDRFRHRIGSPPMTRLVARRGRARGTML